MTLFPRDINIDQLGVRSLFGCLFVYVTKEKAYNLVIFSARKMFLYFLETQSLYNCKMKSVIKSGAILNFILAN